MCPLLKVSLWGISANVPSYTLFAFLGAVTAALLARPALKRAGLSAGEGAALLVTMALSFLIGARLWNYAVNPGNYGGELGLFTLRMAGLSLYGGMFGAAVALIIWSRAIKKELWPLLDGFVPSMAAAFVLARVGCFLNGCCRGKPTHSFLGMVFPMSGTAGEIVNSIPSFIGNLNPAVHPTQLYEAGLVLIALVAAVIAGRKRIFADGVIFLAFTVYFNLVRLLILPLRQMGSYPHLVIGYFYPGLYLAFIAAAIYLLRKKGAGRSTHP